MIIEVSVSSGTDARMKRISELKGRPMSEQEIFDNAVATYWLALEKRGANKTLGKK